MCFESIRALVTCYELKEVSGMTNVGQYHVIYASLIPKTINIYKVQLYIIVTLNNMHLMKGRMLLTNS